MNQANIDDLKLYEALGPEKIVELSTRFYHLVYADSDQGFRAMFPDDMDMAIRNQYEFFIQRFGGPPVYSERKGHPALRARHAHFPITKEYAERWLSFMRQAMDEVGIPEEFKPAMDHFFLHTAYFMQNIDEDGSRIY